MIEIDPTDFESTLAAIKKIEKTASARVKAAIESVLPEVADALSSAAPVDTGTLQRSFGIKTKKFGVDIFAIAGVRSDYTEITPKGKKIPSKTIHLVRFGFTHRSGKQVPANPFWNDVVTRLRPRLQQAIQDAIDDVGRELE
ncbi:MAG: HK97 gp10 family phage protein [Planctomycetaceae bacterium]|nr:HK97 gp10 family phage protein [Planctomycetaceae bacterium]